MTKEDIKRILFVNIENLKKYKVKSIALFGSYVRNEQKDDSDIDFLVEFGEGVTLFGIIELEDSLSEMLRKKVNIVSRRGLGKNIDAYI